MLEAKTIPAKYIFLNIAGFTRNRSVEAQADILQTLNSIVGSSINEYGITKEDVIFLPSGDGICIALLNIESPYDIHLSIALSIIREVEKHNAGVIDKMRRFEVHIGIDAHTDNLVTDINGNQNIAGAGVNTASRLMNLASGNQILLSDTVYKTLHYHEKYISSFRSFKTKVKNNSDLFVHQFIGEDNRGLSLTVPTALQTAVRVEPQLPPLAVNNKNTTIGHVEFNKPSAAADLSPVPEISLPETQKTETLSYLTGILAEQSPAETKPAGWIKPKSEPIPFLEQVVPQKRNYTFLWTVVTLLVVGGAGFGAWMLYNADSSSETKENSATTASSEQVKATATPLPVSSPTAAPTAVSEQTIAETTPKANQAFTPSVPEAAETKKTASSSAPVSRKSFSRPQHRAAARPTILRTIVKPAAAAVKPKQQMAKAVKPKSSKKITLDDLINGNK